MTPKIVISLGNWFTLIFMSRLKWKPVDFLFIVQHYEERLIIFVCGETTETRALGLYGSRFLDLLI